MAYQVLARKWRPQNFNQLVGQEHVSQSLCNALQYDRLHHAYLFTGTRGVGKTTIARILAKAINCESLKENNPCEECKVCQAFAENRFLDLIEVDAASRTKVEDTRDLLDNVQYTPTQGKYKIYLIDEVHMLSSHSFNALLKTLEEPPPHVKFLLATTDPQKIPVTVLSRCLQFNLKRLLPAQIEAQLSFILDEESIDSEPQALKMLSRSADGSLRDGLSLLDQAISFGNGKVALETVTTMLGTVAQQPVDDILLALADNKAPELLQKISNISELTPDFSDILLQIMRVLHRIALAQTVTGFIDNEYDSDFITLLANKIIPEDVQLFYQIALVGQRDLDLAPDPQCGFEMVMLRMLTFKPADSSGGDDQQQQQQPKRKLAEKSAKKQQENDTRTSPSKIAEPEIIIPKPKTQTVKNDWSDMISAMKLQGSARELAANCVLEFLDDKVCRLIVDPGYIRLGSRSEEKLLKAIQSYCGAPLKLEFKSEKTTDATPTQQQAQENEDKQRAAVESIDDDENVKALKENFNVRIIPGSIEPI